MNGLAVVFVLMYTSEESATVFHFQRLRSREEEIHVPSFSYWGEPLVVWAVGCWCCFAVAVVGSATAFCSNPSTAEFVVE